MNRTGFKIGAILVLALGLMIALAPRSTPAAAVRPAERRTHPASLVFPAVDGGTWRLDAHRGKVVLLNFWATWCPPCRAETPALVRVAKAHGDDLVVAGVAMDDTGAAAVRPFVQEYRVPYTMLLPGESLLARNVDSLPTTILFDRQGRAAASYTGAVHESALERDLEVLLAER